MKISFKILISAIALFVPILSFGQTRTIAGTELMTIHAIAEDADGKIWFSTDKTLFSYDGYDLNRFPNSEGSIQGNAIIVKEERLFIGSNRGMFIFNKEDYSFIPCKGLETTMVTALAEIDGIIYAATGNGLYEVSQDEAPEAKLRLKETEGWAILSMTARGENLYLGLLNGYMTFNTLTNELARPETELGAGYYITSLELNDRKELMIGTVEGIQIGEEKKDAKIRSASYNVVKTTSQCTGTNYFIGTDNGLFMYDSQNGSSTKLDDFAVWKIHKARNGLYWFGTDNGLLLYDRNYISHPYPGMDNLGKLIVFSAMRDSKDRMWFCTSSGIAMSDSKGVTWFKVNDSLHPLLHNKVKAITEAEDGTISAVSDGGWLIYNEKSGQMERHTLSDEENWQNWLYDIKSRNGRIWIAGYGGINIIKDGVTENRLTRHDGLSMNDVAGIAFDNGGKMWILTRDQRIAIYDLESEKIYCPEKLKDLRAEAIIADKAGNIWLGDRNKVMMLSEEKVCSSVELYAQDSGTIYDMADIGNNICISTINGLYYVRKANMESSLISNKGRFIGLYADDKTHELLLLGSGYVRALNYDRIEISAAARNRKVYISDVEVSGRHIEVADYDGEKTLKLPHNRNSIKISLSDYSFSDENKFPFSFEVRKGKRLWRSVSQNNKVLMHSLPSGRYQLLIKNQNGSDYSLLRFRILRPWYARNTAIIIYILILVSVTIMAKRYSAAKKKLEEAHRKEEFFDEIARKEIGNEFSRDELTMQSISKLVDDNLKNPKFNLTTLSEMTGMTTKQLYRKIKLATGMSAVEYLRSTRLKKAALLLQSGDYTVSEVMYQVGFTSLSYFSRIFSEMFGQTPTAFMRDGKKDTNK